MSNNPTENASNNKLLWQIVIGLVVGSIIGQIAHSTGESAFMSNVVGFIGILGSLFVGALKGVAPFLVFILVTSAIARHDGKSKTNMRPILFLYMLGTF